MTIVNLAEYVPRGEVMATETDLAREDVLIKERRLNVYQWPAVFAGFFLAMLTYFILMSLGAAIGTSSMPTSSPFEDSVQGIGAGAGIWVLLSCIIALGLGAYATARISGIVGSRGSYFQSGVLTALFFTMLTIQIGLGMGVIGAGIKSVTGSVGDATAQMAQNPAITSVAEDALLDLQPRAMPTDNIIRGVLVRLARGDQDAAMTFFSVNAGIPKEQAQARFENLRARVYATADRMGKAAMSVARAASWMAFAIMTLGTAAAMVAGVYGAQTNFRKPIDLLDKRVLRQHAYT